MVKSVRKQAIQVLVPGERFSFPFSLHNGPKVARRAYVYMHIVPPGSRNGGPSAVLQSLCHGRILMSKKEP